jgi:hypothetical protein
VNLRTLQFRGYRTVRSARHHAMDFVATLEQRRHAPPTDEAARPSHQNASRTTHVPAGVSNRAYAASRADITRGCSGHWIPNAASFQRKPLACPAA